MKGENIMENVLRKAGIKMTIKAENLKERFFSKKKGSQTLDWIVIALIVAVIGGILFVLLKTKMPELFNTIFDKITSVITA